MKNRTFTVRRLCRNHIPMAQKAFSDFDFLHYNPANSENMMDIMLQGQIWAAFDGDIMAGCTWLLPADSSLFLKSDTGWEISDLLETDLSDFAAAGYVWMAEGYENSGIYRAFCKLWVMQASKMGKNMVVHCSPRHINTDMGRLFENGWYLRGLRGLDRLVPHFIFVKKAEFTNTEPEIPRNIKKCPLSDTKQLSRLCEQGWLAVRLDKEANLLFTQGDDCFG